MPKNSELIKNLKSIFLSEHTRTQTFFGRKDVLWGHQNDINSADKKNEKNNAESNCSEKSLQPK